MRRERGPGKKGRQLTHIDLDDLAHARASRLNDGLDVVAAGLGQVANVTGDEVSRGIGGDLAGDEDLAVGTNSLGLDIANQSIESVFGSG